jgi:hypothetical protein
MPGIGDPQIRNSKNGVATADSRKLLYPREDPPFHRGTVFPLFVGRIGPKGPVNPPTIVRLVGVILVLIPVQGPQFVPQIKEREPSGGKNDAV